MSVLGICHLNSMRPDLVNPGMAVAGIQVCGVDPSNPYGPVQSSLDNLDPSATSATIVAALAAVTQTILTGAGYTFGGGDTVTVYGVSSNA
jgi:hypothetical protein